MQVCWPGFEQSVQLQSVPEQQQNHAWTLVYPDGQDWPMLPRQVFPSS